MRAFRLVLLSTLSLAVAIREVRASAFFPARSEITSTDWDSYTLGAAFAKVHAANATPAVYKRTHHFLRRKIVKYSAALRGLQFPMCHLAESGLRPSGRSAL
jgi:hypothetical protein